MPALVTVVGCGALGSHFIQFSRNFNANFKLIDFDKIEQRNLAAQFHSKPSLSKNKAQSVKSLMQFSWGLNDITAMPHKLTSDNCEALLGDATLLVDCTDNAAARTLIRDYARKNGMPCLHGALAANGEYGRVVWSENFKIDAEPGAGTPTCEDGEALPFIATVAGFLVRAAQEFLKNNKRIGFEINPVGVFST